MTKFEKPQKGNPHQLVVNQHTFPAKSIARFADPSGRVQLQMKTNKLVRRAKPSDSIFCARRAWDHASEVMFMKKIEDNFQCLAELILDGQVLSFNEEQTRAISFFYALWLARAQIRDQPEKDAVLPGIWPDHARSKDQEEELEKEGIAFFRRNILLARMKNGVAVHVHIARHFRQINPTANWGIVHASNGEFVVPDWPLVYAFVPITPTLALVNHYINQRLDRGDVRLVNKQLRSASRRYFFARDFAACP
jgi:hypothetical protein